MLLVHRAISEQIQEPEPLEALSGIVLEKSLFLHYREHKCA